MNIFRKQKGTGALEDTRKPQEKEKDFHLNELVTTMQPVEWKEKDTWNTYPIFDQNGSGSCVAQTLAKMLGIMYLNEHGEYVHFSATDAYQRRSNAPGGGMIGVDALRIATKGVTFESLVPSQSMTDAQMDAIVIEDYKRRVGEIFKADNFVQLKTNDIDAIASTIQATGKPVMVWYYFNHDEWTDTPKLKRDMNPYARSTSRHSVTAVDSILINGIKHLVIDDSWGTKYGKKGQRFISEDFHNKRNLFAAYLTNFDFSKKSIPKLLRYTFKKTMRVGDRNSDVVALQDFLKSKGMFPSNVDSTGYFGSITKRAVIQYQKANKLTVDGIVGKNTIASLNK